MTRLCQPDHSDDLTSKVFMKMKVCNVDSMIEGPAFF